MMAMFKQRYYDQKVVYYKWKNGTIEGVFTCPEDNLPLDYAKIYPDPDAEVAIMGSIVYCIHYKDGCKWSDELRKLQGHLNMCKYDAIPCTNHCGAMIPRLVMEDHLLYTCPKRRTRCEYCSRDFTGETLENHVGSCQLEPIYCENKCGSKIQRRHQSNHRLHECTKRLIPCRYCQKEFVYDTLQIHTAKCPRLPVTCPNRCDILKIAKEDLETHLNEHCSALILPCSFKEMGCKFKGTRSAVDQHLEEACKPHLSLVCSVVSRQQHQISNLRAAVQNLTLNTSGTMLWKITDYTRRLGEARDGYELVSSPFYTSQHGYKLMASLFLNGNGTGEGTHLSVYIKILPGEYDALLPWPFSHTVTFVLYDQSPTQETACNIVESFVPDPTWKNFQQPSKEPDALGFGFPRFVSHEILKKKNYIKDDVMFIKVRVDGNKTVAV
ncbi:TNF receptor-associated factor 4 isoform X2 [Parasteatoda tepidariorum]|uniref:TNF receptor-associated factor 4 isoform X2 n=2 Tax=Parasteatoda tepidariorum TaxID=114398 RepID=UPI001C71CABE|nr:TNF receptor-associated factor 4 isoform X2 [Parasteatoda tepidariorum]